MNTKKKYVWISGSEQPFFKRVLWQKEALRGKVHCRGGVVDIERARVGDSGDPAGYGGVVVIEQQVPTSRVPQAQLLYRETEASIAARGKRRLYVKRVL